MENEIRGEWKSSNEIQEELRLNRLSFVITHQKDDEVLSDGTVIHYDIYAASLAHATAPILFSGTYRECLIYVGARSMNHQHITAVNFARDIYR